MGNIGAKFLMVEVWTEISDKDCRELISGKLMLHFKEGFFK